MDKPFEELALLIGKVLARRWLDQNAKRPKASARPSQDRCDGNSESEQRNPS